MTRRAEIAGYEYMNLDDFEEMLPDRPAHEKWELIGGRVVRMMVGARWSHHRIVQNVNFLLSAAFRDRSSSCRVYTETFWLKERFLDLAAFPDVMVHCGAVGRDETSISDPVALFEVISPGSVVRDRHEKNDVYSRLPSLQHYVMIDRDAPSIDVIDRTDARSWSSRRLNGLDQSLRLDALDVDISLAEIYRDVIDA